MRCPSGDQDGPTSGAVLFVSRVTPSPSSFVTYISKFPSRPDSNAMRRPSGDQEGRIGKPSLAAIVVSRDTSDPSASITYIPKSPSSGSPETNAIRPVGIGVAVGAGDGVCVAVVGGVAVGVGDGVCVAVGGGVAVGANDSITRASAVAWINASATRAATVALTSASVNRSPHAISPAAITATPAAAIIRSMKDSPPRKCHPPHHTTRTISPYRRRRA